MGVISNSDFGDANDNWIYDKYPTTENASTNLNLYAKWTPLKTHIILDASGASNGTNGEAWVEYDNTKLTTITSVEPIQTTTTHVLGYFTEPDCHGADNGVMVLTSTGDFVTTPANVGEGKYFRNASSTYKWYKYNTQNEDTPLEIKLYAHYVVDPNFEVGLPTLAYIDYEWSDYDDDYLVNGTSNQVIEIEYGAESFGADYFPPKSALGGFLVGIFTDENCSEENRVAYDDGKIVDKHDVSGYTKDGKWIYVPSGAVNEFGANIRLYPKWSNK